jgi:hypothetical protein
MGFSFGDILGSLSPAFGLASGKGVFGKLPLNGIGQSGLGGILGLLLSHPEHGQANQLDGQAPATPPPMGGMGGGFGMGTPPSTGMNTSGYGAGQAPDDGGLSAMLMRLGIMH